MTNGLKTGIEVVRYYTLKGQKANNSLFSILNYASCYYKNAQCYWLNIIEMQLKEWWELMQDMKECSY
jgi:hypothetical protein